MEATYRLMFHYVPANAPHDPSGASRVTRHMVECADLAFIHDAVRKLRRGDFEINRHTYGLVDCLSFKIERVQIADVTQRVKHLLGLDRWEP